MPKNRLWKTERENGLERHEILESYNRQKSIEDGLVIFITHEQHFGKNGRSGFQYDQRLKNYVELIAQDTWCKYYGKTKEDFRKRYGFNVVKKEFEKENDFEQEFEK